MSKYVSLRVFVELWPTRSIPFALGLHEGTGRSSARWHGGAILRFVDSLGGILLVVQNPLPPLPSRPPQPEGPGCLDRTNYRKKTRADVSRAPGCRCQARGIIQILGVFFFSALAFWFGRRLLQNNRNESEGPPTCGIPTAHCPRASDGKPPDLHLDASGKTIAQHNCDLCKKHHVDSRAPFPRAAQVVWLRLCPLDSTGQGLGTKVRAA